MGGYLCVLFTILCFVCASVQPDNIDKQLESTLNTNVDELKQKNVFLPNLQLLETTTKELEIQEIKSLKKKKHHHKRGPSYKTKKLRRLKHKMKSKKGKKTRAKRLVTRQNHMRHLKWTHSIWLGEAESSPRLYWSPKDNYVEFKVEANTIGSINIGFDEKDLVVLWVDDVTKDPHLKDCHYGNSTSHILEDTEDSYFIVAGEQNSTHSVVAFRRPWTTCDPEDTPLGNDTVRISWSIHPHDPGETDAVDSDLTQDIWNKENVVRGTKSLLLRAPVPQEVPKKVAQWDVLMKNVIIEDDMSTQYWCKVFRTPHLSKKNHIIAYEPLLLSNLSNLVHHMLLYECNALPGYLDSYALKDHAGAPCYSPHMPRDWESCVTPVATWVIGGGAKVLPEHVGFPIGSRQTYFMLEIHYDNPGLKRVVDNSGFRLYMTEALRQYDAGVMMTGVTVSPLHIVPPKQEIYKSSGLCNDVCTEKIFPEMGINVVSVLLHSHLAGRAMRLRHVRGDKEMPVIVQDQKYDFNYQVDRKLEDEVRIFPGDQLITECDYSTVDRKTITLGGYSTREEMCLSFITYYPRTRLASCQSMTPVSYFLETLGVQAFYDVTLDEVEKFVLRTAPIPKPSQPSSTTAATFLGSDEAAIEALKSMAHFIVNEVETDEQNFLLNLIISEPSEFRNHSLLGHLSALPWDSMLFTQRVEDNLNQGLHMVFCRQNDDKLAYGLMSENFPNFTALKTIDTNEECLKASSLHRGLAHLSVPNVFITSILFLSLFAL